MRTDDLIILGLCIIVGLNLYATFRVFRSNSFEISQKIAQTILIWILPVIGSILMISFSDKDDDFGSGSSYGGGHDSSPAGGYDNGGAAD